MRKIDERLRTEARRYLFRFGCSSCAYFVEETKRCSEGYPVDAHLSEALEEKEIIFCKLFEGA